MAGKLSAVLMAVLAISQQVLVSLSFRVGFHRVLAALHPVVNSSQDLLLELAPTAVPGADLVPIRVL